MPSESTYYSEMTIGIANGNVRGITNYKDTTHGWDAEIQDIDKSSARIKPVKRGFS